MKDQQKLQYIANRLNAKIGEECGTLQLKASYQIGWDAFTFIASANGVGLVVRGISPKWIKEDDQWIDDRIIDPMTKLWDQSAKNGSFPEITKIYGELFFSAE